MGNGRPTTTNAVGRTSDGMGNIFVPSVSDLCAHFRFGGAQLKLDESLLGRTLQKFTYRKDNLWVERKKQLQIRKLLSIEPAAP